MCRRAVPGPWMGCLSATERSDSAEAEASRAPLPIGEAGAGRRRMRRAGAPPACAQSNGSRHSLEVGARSSPGERARRTSQVHPHERGAVGRVLRALRSPDWAGRAMAPRYTYSSKKRTSTSYTVRGVTPRLSLCIRRTSWSPSTSSSGGAPSLVASFSASRVKVPVVR